MMLGAETGSLKLLTYLGIAILGFGMFVLFATLPEVVSPYANWIVITIVGFPLTVGSFLIVLGQM